MRFRDMFESGSRLSNESFDATIDGKQYKVVVSRADDFEVRKRWVDVVLPDGSKVHVDWSPYARFEEEDLKLWIKLGMPTRKAANTNGPLTSELLKKLDTK